MNTTALLKFADEPTAIAALAQYRDANGWITGSHTHALDPIGTLYTPAVLNPDGTVKTPAVALPGWHCNLIGDVPAAADSARTGPVTPLRLYAGSSWAQAAPLLTGNVTPGLYQDASGVAWVVIQAYNADVYTDPTAIPALVHKLRLPGGDWVQPLSTNPYRLMNPYTGQPDDCYHGGKHWVTLVDNNVWEPGAVGSEKLWRVLTA